MDIIRDARFFDAEWVPNPEVVRHRNQEMNQISTALQSVEEYESGGEVFLFGPSGSGKTCIARVALDKMRQEVPDVQTQYINCWRDYTSFRTLYRILEGIGETMDIHRQSTPTDELIDRIHEYDERPYVVILDEVDQLQDKNILYDLYRAPMITMIPIANREEDLFAQLDERLLSRLRGAQQVHLNRYGLEELTAILDERAKHGLRGDVIDEDRLEYISNAVAGDARVGINILGNAAQRAETGEHEQITENDIQNVITESRVEIREKHIDKLTPHQKTLHDILQKEGELTASELYSEYESEVDDPKTERTMRNYLAKMERYDLVIRKGEKRGRTYRLKSN